MLGELRKMRDSKSDLESELYVSKIHQDEHDTIKHRLNDTEVWHNALLPFIRIRYLTSSYMTLALAC